MASSGPTASGSRPILVGLSAHNEVETVAEVAKVAAEGLARHFPGRPSVVVLSDNGSTDGTVEAFRSARFEGDRLALVTERGRTGKGYAVRAVLEEAARRGAGAVVLMDADLVNARPDWIERLARPVLEGRGLVTPLYRRDARDGAVTRHVGYPVARLFTALDIRQPIGGEYALSGDLVERLLSREWPRAAFGYGVDILVTLEAAKAGLEIPSSRLGAKVHSPSAPKLVRIFREVASTVFALAAEGRFPGEDVEEVREVTVLGEEIREDVPPVDVHVPSFIYVARAAWKECTSSGGGGILAGDLCRRVDRAFESDEGRVDERLWHDCLAEALRQVRGGADPTEAAETLLAAFLGRTACFWEEVHDLSIDEVEEMVAESADRFLVLARAALRP